MDDWYILTNARNATHIFNYSAATTTTTTCQKNRFTLRADVFWPKFGSRA